jgi:hypothetical protein
VALRSPQRSWPRHSAAEGLDDTALLCESSHHDVHHGRTLRLKDGRRFNANGWLD